MYFAVPLGSDTTQDAFSGQYLRLEEYAGTQEDPHLPASLSKIGLKGISISSTGSFLLSARGVQETFGKALTEKISGNHTIEIEKGDWKLTASKGAITITSADSRAQTAGSEPKILFETTDSDIYFEARNGLATTSDRIDVKTSKTNSVTFVAGFEYSGTQGTVTKEYKLFVMKINVAGEVFFKAMNTKFEAFPLKYGYTSYGFYIATLKFQLINLKLAVTDAKTMVVYNKVTWVQIYNSIATVEEQMLKDDLTITNTTERLAAAEHVANDCSLMQLLQM